MSYCLELDEGEVMELHRFIGSQPSGSTLEITDIVYPRLSKLVAKIKERRALMNLSVEEKAVLYLNSLCNVPAFTEQLKVYITVKGMVFELSSEEIDRLSKKFIEHINQ